MFSVDLERYFLNNFSDNQKAKKVISCAQYMRDNLNPEEVTFHAMKAFGAPFFIYGSCGVLACLLDVLYGNEHSKLVAVVDKKSYDSYKPFRKFKTYTNQQVSVFTNIVDGFAHVYWFHNGKYYDVIGAFENFNIAILSSCEDIDYNDPVGLYLDHKSMKESPFSNHVTIIKGTSGEIEISDLILAIYEKIDFSIAA